MLTFTNQTGGRDAETARADRVGPTVRWWIGADRDLGDNVAARPDHRTVYRRIAADSRRLHDPVSAGRSQSVGKPFDRSAVRRRGTLRVRRSGRLDSGD